MNRVISAVFLVFSLSLLLVIGVPLNLGAQQYSSANLVQQSATAPNAATKTAGFNSAINTQSTATATPAGGNYVYVTAVDMGVCGNATGTVQTNVAWNFTGGITPSGNIPVWAYSTAINPAICTYKVITYPTPLKSITPGTAVTLQSPAAAAQTAYAANIYWYEAP